MGRVSCTLVWPFSTRTHSIVFRPALVRKLSLRLMDFNPLLSGIYFLTKNIPHFTVKNYIKTKNKTLGQERVGKRFEKGSQDSFLWWVTMLLCPRQSFAQFFRSGFGAGFDQAILSFSIPALRSFEEL